MPERAHARHVRASVGVDGRQPARRAVRRTRVVVHQEVGELRFNLEPLDRGQAIGLTKVGCFHRAFERVDDGLGVEASGGRGRADDLSESGEGRLILPARPRP